MEIELGNRMGNLKISILLVARQTTFQKCLCIILIRAFFYFAQFILAAVCYLPAPLTPSPTLALSISGDKYLFLNACVANASSVSVACRF